MSSSVFNLTILPAEERSSIGAALGEVTAAFKHLAAALVSKVFASTPAQARNLTAFEEAEELRSFAADMQAQDPNFAQDLFAAADRHEIEAAAR